MPKERRDVTLNTTEDKFAEECEFRILSDSEFNALFEELRPQVFAKFFEIDIDSLMTVAEKAADDLIHSRLAALLRFNLVAFYKGNPIAWSFGRQEGRQTFLMINSGVLPAYCRRGMYRALLTKVLDWARESGFQIVKSTHSATNNPIIIAKLKAGFRVTGLVVSDEFGTQVQLSYYFNELREKALSVRTGALKPDEMLIRVMGL